MSLELLPKHGRTIRLHTLECAHLGERLFSPVIDTRAYSTAALLYVISNNEDQNCAVS